MPRKLSTMERRARRDVKQRSLARNLTAKQKAASQAAEKPLKGASEVAVKGASEGAAEKCFVSGHGFSRAEKSPKSTGALAPEKSSSTSAAPQLVEIEKPVYGGSFLAHAGGKAVFVPLALPGEQALVRVTTSKRGYATAEAEQIVRVAPERIAPACPHFGVCGCCCYQHSNYAAQLAFKQAILRETLERGGVNVPAEIAVLSGQPWRYRNRIRLAFDAAGNPGYRGRRSHAVVPLRECPIAAPLLVEAALAFAPLARPFALRPTEISLFCNAAETSLLATVFTATPKKIQFNELARAFQEKIPALTGAELLFEGRSGQPPRSLAQWGAASLAYRAAGFDYRVDHGAFFQVNRWLVDSLVEKVIDGHSGQLAWDLFAGVGLFARQLAARFERVVAVESAPEATKALAANLIDPATKDCAEMGGKAISLFSSRINSGAALTAETLAFLRGSRKPSSPHSTRPDLIVVDPPRTGLGAETCALLAKIAAPSLAYVSCDPATLARDLRALLASGYQIQSIVLADLFPQTFHLETVVQLRRA